MDEDERTRSAPVWGRGVSRRTALRRFATGTLAAGLAGGTGRAIAAPRDEDTPKSIGWNGIAGGGLVQWEEGEANLELSTLRLRRGEEVLALTGHVMWVDAGWEGMGLVLESTTIEAYGPLAGQEETAREVRGRMQANGEGEHPFVLRAVDGGLPGSGQDRVALLVGDAAVEGSETALRYAAEGPLVTGGLQRVLYAFPDPGVQDQATPIP